MYVLMVTPSNFPNGDAGAVRDYAFAQIYITLGYEVVHIGMGVDLKQGLFHDVQFFSLFQKRDNRIEQLKSYITYPKRFIQLVDQYTNKNGNPAIIHINDVDEKVIKYLVNLSCKLNVPIVHDSTEWYSPCEFKKGKFDKAYYLKDRLNKKLITKPIRVIAISRYLETFFQSRGLKTIRIPVIMDVMENQKNIERDYEQVRFIYAGSPAGKDYLKEIVDGFESLSEEEKNKIQLHIVGINQKQLSVLCGKNSFGSYIKVHGRVARDKVIELLRVMDFSVLLRPEKERYAKAGFPTKSVEAMVNGVAMMCNISSDLGNYLIDGENAIIVKGCAVECVTESIRNILKLNKMEIIDIKKRARKTAENYFDYRLYTAEVKRLIKEE